MTHNGNMGKLQQEFTYDKHDLVLDLIKLHETQKHYLYTWTYNSDKIGFQDCLNYTAKSLI